MQKSTSTHKCIIFEAIFFFIHKEIEQHFSIKDKDFSDSLIKSSAFDQTSGTKQSGEEL